LALNSRVDEALQIIEKIAKANNRTCDSFVTSAYKVQSNFVKENSYDINLRNDLFALEFYHQDRMWKGCDKILGWFVQNKTIAKKLFIDGFHMVNEKK